MTLALAAILVATVALVLNGWVIGAHRTITTVRRALPRPYAEWNAAERAAVTRLERHPLLWP